MTESRPWNATRAGTSRLALICLTALACVAAIGTAATPEPHPALAHVERAAIEMRTDPEASKRDADEALRLLQQQPDADLEIRARLILCDYLSERDTQAAEREID